MLKKLAAIGFGAAIALSPIAVLAQTTAPAAGTTEAKPMTSTGSHRSHRRNKSRTAHQRARAGAAAAQQPKP